MKLFNFETRKFGASVNSVEHFPTKPINQDGICFLRTSYQSKRQCYMDFIWDSVNRNILLLFRCFYRTIYSFIADDTYFFIFLYFTFETVVTDRSGRRILDSRRDIPLDCLDHFSQITDLSTGFFTLFIIFPHRPMKMGEEK